VTDSECIKKVRLGNTGAYRVIVERYKSLVAATVYGMLGKTPDAEDVGQEVFIRFYKALGEFRGDSTIGTYLTRIALNLSVNQLKIRKKKRLFIGDVTVDQCSGDDDPIRNPVYRELEKAIVNLAPRYRIVVLLRLVQGYSTAETAVILGIPEGTVSSRLMRAQEELRKKMR